VNKIHHSAIISPKAKIFNNVKVGPYCTIGENVTINEGSELISHVNISGNTTIGMNNLFYPFSSIGSIPQDLKYQGEKSKLIIKNENIFREHVTINTGTEGGGMLTKIGNKCLLMVGVHIAHDCEINNNVIFANNATLAGHVRIDDNSIIGGLSAIHQFVRIGKFAMIGGMSGVEQDIIPYGLYMGIRSRLRGLNVIGLKRKGLSSQEISNIKKIYLNIFDNKNTIDKNIKDLENTKLTEIDEIINFIKEKSSRGMCTPENG
tara:strand:+ start:715 stop:1500 length:786 start_codon:yes stop_codon:yes gene_type:complete